MFAGMVILTPLSRHRQCGRLLELETWDSTPASITEPPSFQLVDCPIPLLTEEIFDELRNDDEN